MQRPPTGFASELWFQERRDPFLAAESVRDRLTQLRETIDSTPKTRRWKMRAKVGTRVQWYEEVEEVDR